jgi:hypothetical protein
MDSTAATSETPAAFYVLPTELSNVLAERKPTISVNEKGYANWGKGSVPQIHVKGTIKYCPSEKQARPNLSVIVDKKEADALRSAIEQHLKPLVTGLAAQPQPPTKKRVAGFAPVEVPFYLPIRDDDVDAEASVVSFTFPYNQEWVEIYEFNAEGEGTAIAKEQLKRFRPVELHARIRPNHYTDKQGVEKTAIDFELAGLIQEPAIPSAEEDYRKKYAVQRTWVNYDGTVRHLPTRE